MIFFIQTAFSDIFLIFLFSTKNRKLKQWDNFVALFYFLFFQFFLQKWKNDFVVFIVALFYI